jgi:hypothetical protein
MKKYIAIAALVVASIVLVAFAVLPGHSADNTTAQPLTNFVERIRQEMKRDIAEREARLAQTGSMLPPIKGQLVECPKLCVDDTGPDGVLVTTLLERKGGRTMTSGFNPALAPIETRAIG